MNRWLVPRHDKEKSFDIVLYNPGLVLFDNASSLSWRGTSHLFNCFPIPLQPIHKLERNTEEMYNVKFKFEQKGLEPVLFKNVEAGQTLLELALKNHIELHHNCGGVCSCTTCHIYVQNGMENLGMINRREKDFIERAVNPRLNSRLGCQSLLQDGRGEIEALIPDQTQFPGE